MGNYMAEGEIIRNLNDSVNPDAPKYRARSSKALIAGAALLAVLAFGSVKSKMLRGIGWVWEFVDVTGYEFRVCVGVWRVKEFKVIIC